MKKLIPLLGLILSINAFAFGGESIQEKELRRVIVSLRMELEEDVFYERIDAPTASIIFRGILNTLSANTNSVKNAEATAPVQIMRLVNFEMDALMNEGLIEPTQRHHYVTEISKLKIYCYLNEHTFPGVDNQFFDYRTSIEFSQNEQRKDGTTMLDTEKDLRATIYPACMSFLNEHNPSSKNKDWFCKNVQNKTLQCIDPREKNVRALRYHDIELPKL